MTARSRLSDVLLLALGILQIPSLVPAADPERPIKVCGFRPGVRRDFIDLDGLLDPPQFPGIDALPSDPLAGRKISTALDYVREESWAHAVHLLQPLLDAPQDAFLPSADGTANPRASARAEAERVVSELPSAGQEYYELYAGRLAADRLRAAGTDLHLLGEIVRRYLHTRAGAVALARLGALHLDRGRALPAADCFRRLLRLPRTEPSPATLFQAALAFRLAGDPAAEEVAWQRLTARAPDGLRLGQRVVGLRELRRQVDGTSPGSAVQFEGGIPFLEPRWQASSIGRDETRQRVEAGIKQIEAEGGTPLAAFFPVAVGGKVVYRSYAGVHAIDLATGREVWNSPSPLSYEGILADPGKKVQIEDWMRRYEGAAQPTHRGINLGVAGGGLAGIGGGLGGDFQGRPAPYRSHASLLFENSVVGRLSTDGRRVYVVEDLPLPPHPDEMELMKGGIARHFGPLRDAVYHNRLRAIDLDTGKTTWEVGGRGAGALNDCFFLGPPLCLAGQLHALVEKGGELRLVCLDAGRGTLAWTQLLATFRATILTDAGRRVRAAPMLHGEGLLLCPTNAGTVLAFDPQTRTLSWAHTYFEKAPPVRGLPPESPGTWKESDLVIHEGRLIFTAPDTEELHCINLRDGTPAWKVFRDKDDLYLAGVTQGRVLVAGRKQFRALSLADGGRELWRVETGTPSGRGALAEGVYYLPVKEGAVCAIDVRRGAVTARARSHGGGAPGNLLFHREELLSQTATQVTSYPLLRARLARVAERLVANPRDPAALTERGVLRSDQGDLAAAVADFRAALANDPPGDLLPRTHVRLHDVLAQLIGADFLAGEKYLDEYRRLCEAPLLEGTQTGDSSRLREERDRRLATYFFLLARGREQQGRLVDALPAYRQLHALAHAGQPVTITAAAAVQARPDVWVRGRVTELLAKATIEQRRALEAEVNREWKQLQAADPSPLEEFVALFGTAFDAGRDARLLLVERLIADREHGRFLEAELHLLALRDDPARAARATEALARLATRKGLLDDALEHYQALGRDHARVVVRDGRTGAELLDEITADKRFLSLLDGGRQTGGRFKVTEERVDAPLNPAHLVFLPEGEVPASLRRQRLVLDLASSRVRLLDGATGTEIWSQRLALGSRIDLLHEAAQTGAALPCHVAGHLVVLDLGYMACAIDLIDRRVLWQRSLIDTEVAANERPVAFVPDRGWEVVLTGPRAAAAWRVRLVTGTGVVLQAVSDLAESPSSLRVLDPVRGHVAWSRAVPWGTSLVLGNAAYVCLARAAPGESLVLRMADGGRVPAPPFTDGSEKRLGVLGSSLLLWEDDARGGRVLRRYDPVRGRDLWKRSYAPALLPVHSADARFAGLIDTDGRVIIVETATGKELLRATVEPKHLANVEVVRLLADRTRFYLVPYMPPGGEGLSGAPELNYRAGPAGAWVNGMVHAFDRATGRLCWRAQVPCQVIVPDPFDDLPILFCSARLNRTGSIVVATRSYDKETGKLLYAKQVAIASDENRLRENERALADLLFHTVRLDPGTGAIELISPRLKIRHQRIEEE